MRPERYRQVKEIYAAAVECDTGERAGLLARACAGDEELRTEVESLLAHDRPAENFIEESAFEVTARLLASGEARSLNERRIGPYKVIREIGRGGMGVVYLAARDDDHFHKEVAIKLIKRGMDTDAVVRRFRTERQILAGLEHPFIARLLDGGATADSLPYLVMEHVVGTPVTDYCDRHGLTTGERLRLFRDICTAVEHAHRNLIVHRDLKPTNILITPDGTPKLLDFGIAKVLNPVQSGLTMELTRPNLRALTPDYASPEQVRGQKITTASDIYSLGVILYELLAGSRPYRLKEASPEEMARVICETEPPRPSDAAGGARTPNPRPAAHNPKLLRGDLDNIVLKALRKEPERRYKSVELLSEDIKRHLEGLPVIARKDTFAYRASKFIARHKLGAAAAALIVLAVLAGLTVSIQQARVARRERAKAEAVSRFLQTTMLASSPASGFRMRKNVPTVRDVLDEAAKRLAAGDLSDQPEAKAELQRIIGASYLSQGEYDLAEQTLKSALAIQTQLYGEDDLETLKTTVVLAEVRLNKGDNAWADQFYRRNLPVLRAGVEKGTLSPQYLMGALYNYALLRRAQGDSKEAEALLREKLALTPQSSPDDKESLGISAEGDRDLLEGTIALTLDDQGKLDEAQKITRSIIVSSRQRRGGEVPELALAGNLTGLGRMLAEVGDLAEAEETLREAESLYRKLFDSNNYLPLGDHLRIHAQTLYLRGKYAEAEAKINECLEIYRKNTGPAYINYATAVMIQGSVYAQTGRTGEAEKLLREAVRLRRQYSPEGHFMRAVAEGELGKFLTARGRYDEAEPLLLSSYESLKNSQAPNSPRLRAALERLAALYESWGRQHRAAIYRGRV